MIQVFRPVMETEEILAALRPVLNSGWIGLGPKTKEFEARLSDFIGARHFCALNSCTSALHMAVRSLGLPVGSRVLTTPNTFVSTNHALLYESLEPVFCDVERTTGILDADLVEEAIKRYDIQAIVGVHFGGYSMDMDKINSIARFWGIPVIEDCAHAFGGMYKGKRIGDTDNVCAWSFHAVKNLPVGDGGALSTNSQDLHKLFNKLRWLGIDKDTYTRNSNGYSWEYNVEQVGFKYHMNDIAATIGLVQLKKVEAQNARRQQIAEYYVKNIRCAQAPDYQADRISSYHFMPMFFEDRDAVYHTLMANDIFPSGHYKRNDQYGMYEKFIKVGGCEFAEWYQNHVLILPMHLDMSDNDVSRVVEVLNS